MRRQWLEHEELRDRVDHLSSPGPSVDPNHQVEPAVLVDHHEELDGPPIHGLVELEVDRADVMGVFSTQQLPFASARP